MWVVIRPMLNDGTTGTDLAPLAVAINSSITAGISLVIPSSVELFLDVRLDHHVGLWIGDAGSAWPC